MAIEDESVSALTMDRGLPLGNSLDTQNRRALHTKVTNKITEPIPTYTVDAGSPVFFQDSRNTIPGTTQSLISFVVPANTRRDIFSVRVVCRAHGMWRLTLNTLTIASGRTGPANANNSFDFRPARPIAASDSVELTFQSTADSSVKGVEAYVMASDSSV